MVEAGRGAGFLVEARLVTVGAILLERHVDGLHRHDALEHRIGRLVDDAHRSTADLGLDEIASQLRRFDRGAYFLPFSERNTGPQTG
jgi:hypothetical protein